VGGVTLNAVAAKSVTPPSGNAIVVCNGTVKSFDGTPLDVDVSLPAAGVPAGGAPLAMLLSGWSNDICQFESTTLEGTAVPNCGTNDFIGHPGYH
jgi:hypothetical protein